MSELKTGGTEPHSMPKEINNEGLLGTGFNRTDHLYVLLKTFCWVFNFVTYLSGVRLWVGVVAIEPGLERSPPPPPLPTAPLPPIPPMPLPRPP